MTVYETHEVPYDEIVSVSDAVCKIHWISVTAEMPLEHDSIFKKLKGTPNWDSFMWATCSDTVLVTYEFEDGTRAVDTCDTHDGEWYITRNIVPKKVIAWAYLPEPYNEK